MRPKNKVKTKLKLFLFPCYRPNEDFFGSSTMLIYITVQILRTFHFSFPLLRHGPPSYSFHLFDFFSCDCYLTENYQSTFSQFDNRNAN